METTNTRALKLMGNDNAAKGKPTKPNRQRYPLDGYPTHCDGCHVMRCPKRERNAVCAYRREFDNIEARGIAQVLDELSALAGEQRQRVVRSLMVENLMLGGLNDRQTGREIDRQAKLVALIAHLRAVESHLKASPAPLEFSCDSLFVKLGLVTLDEPPSPPTAAT